MFSRAPFFLQVTADFKARIPFWDKNWSALYLKFLISTKIYIFEQTSLICKSQQMKWKECMNLASPTIYSVMAEISHLISGHRVEVIWKKNGSWTFAGSFLLIQRVYNKGTFPFLLGLCNYRKWITANSLSRTEAYGEDSEGNVWDLSVSKCRNHIQHFLFFIYHKQYFLFFCCSLWPRILYIHPAKLSITRVEHYMLNIWEGQGG